MTPTATSRTRRKTGARAATPADRFGAARSVADAVLYEGYLLYPYRASATKNRVRWQFGVVVPAGFVALDPSERSHVRTEVVVAPGAEPVLHVRARFLQVQQRIVTVVGAGVGAADDSWDEACEQQIDLEPVPLSPTGSTTRSFTFRVDGGDDVEVDGDRRTTRRRLPIDARADIAISPVDDGTGLLRIAVTVANEVAAHPPTFARAEAVRQALVGLHLLLAADDAAFVSATDPPTACAAAVAACVGDGLYPVLVADGHGGDVVLASPIILYDHPEISPESPGDMFDATEIDEILALRVLTLTDEEKAEGRRTDSRAAAIIDRCDNMPPELWTRLHGTMRPVPTMTPVAEPEPEPMVDPFGPDPFAADPFAGDPFATNGLADETPWWDPAADAAFDPFTTTTVIGGAVVGAGTAVRLRPSHRSDAHDMFLAGMDATVGGVFTDVDGDVHVAVTVDEDPATEALAWQGRHLFFHPDEIEVRP